MGQGRNAPPFSKGPGGERSPILSQERAWSNHFCQNISPMKSTTHQIRISLKSFNRIYIERSREEIAQLLLLLEELNGKKSFHDLLEKERIFPLPTLWKGLTVLKSPHIDKKSREQFSWSRRKSQLRLSLREKKYADLFLLLLRNCEFPGVELKISRVYSSSL